MMINEDRDAIKSFLLNNWCWLARGTKVLKGLRMGKEPEQLLRALFIHFGGRHSLRETAGRVNERHIAELSDVALLKRLRKSKIGRMRYAGQCYGKAGSQRRESEAGSFAFSMRP